MMEIPNILPSFLVDQPDRIFWLFGGYLMAPLINRLERMVFRTSDRLSSGKIKPVWIIMIFMFCISIYIGAQTQQNGRHTKQVANESATCWITFGENMVARSYIASENDRLTIVDLTAIRNLHGEIAHADPRGLTAEEQLALLKTRVSQAFGVEDQVLAKLVASQAERAQHPVRVPQCRLTR